MRIIFMGTPEFAVPSLQAILDAGHEIPLVVSTPDMQKGRGLKVASSAVKRYALEKGLEVATPESLKESEVADFIRSKQPDVICVVAFRILPESIYSIPSKGSFNLHGSLLPKYRGAAPINWAIINGENETGVTTFFLKKQVDTGSIILQRQIPIGPEMTAGELHDVMMEVGAGAVVETLRLIEHGEARAMPQDDRLASPAPKIFRDDCRIDWTKPAQEVHDFIRGLSPYPGAFTSRDGKVLKIYRARIDSDSSLPEQILGLQPGQVYTTSDTLLVGTGTGAVTILEIQQEGKRSMTIEEFMRGYIFEQGELLR